MKSKVSKISKPRCESPTPLHVRKPNKKIEEVKEEIKKANIEVKKECEPCKELPPIRPIMAQHALHRKVVTQEEVKKQSPEPKKGLLDRFFDWIGAK